jgi:hypothetical protein
MAIKSKLIDKDMYFENFLRAGETFFQVWKECYPDSVANRIENMRNY